jgi:uncharacterized membrane protein
MKKKRKVPGVSRLKTTPQESSSSSIHRKKIKPQEKKFKNSKTKKKNNSQDKKYDIIISRLDEIEESQRIMRSKEEQIIRDEHSLLKLEQREIDEESILEKKEDEELDELKKITALEENIKKGLKDTPLKRVTYKDVTKGIIGAFFGIIGHFSFVEGTHLSENFSFLRSTMLLVTAFAIILIFLYFTGFRKVNDKFVLEFIPVRAIVIFCSSIMTVFFVLFLYGMINSDTHFMHLYNSVAAISILAVIGSGTADLIGKNE